MKVGKKNKKKRFGRKDKTKRRKRNDGGRNYICEMQLQSAKQLMFLTTWKFVDLKQTKKDDTLYIKRKKMEFPCVDWRKVAL